MTDGEAAVWASAPDLFGTMFGGLVVLATTALGLALAIVLMSRYVRP